MAAFRLAIFERACLYEAYTGSIIAGKGKMLRNIRDLTERRMAKFEGWGFVRFAPGDKWTRCWIVVNPPDEKDARKLQKASARSSGRSVHHAPLTGDIKFYDSKKMKKMPPFAKIVDAYSAYAVYPQSNDLIDQSSLVKVEGHVVTNTGSGDCAFVMPEPRGPVSGLEVMLQFLFPTFDTFGLYGRPTRLIAETNHIKSLMFAFPNHRERIYLDVRDVVALIQRPGSQNWTEAEWWKQLKETTLARMSHQTYSHSRSVSLRNSEAGDDSQARGARFLAEDVPSQPQQSGYTRREGYMPGRAPEPPYPGARSREPSGYYVRGQYEMSGGMPEPPYPAAIHREPDYYGPRGGDMAFAYSRSQARPRESGYYSPQTTEAAERRSGQYGVRPEAPLSASTGGKPPDQQFLAEFSPMSPIDNPFLHHGVEEQDGHAMEDTSESHHTSNDDFEPRAGSPSTKIGQSERTATLMSAIPAVEMPPEFSHGTGDVPKTRPQPSAEMTDASNRMSHGTVALLTAQQKPRMDEGSEDGYPTDAEARARAHRDLCRSDENDRDGTRDDTIASNEPRKCEAGSFENPSPSRPTSSGNRTFSFDNDKALKRKPVGGQPRQTEKEDKPGSYRQAVSVDLGQVMKPTIVRSNKENRSARRSLYFPNTRDDDCPDNASSISPDYASTRGSEYSKQSECDSKPRMGVMKTVGGEPKEDLVIGDARYAIDKPQDNSFAIPEVDFGPTLSLLPTTGQPKMAEPAEEPSYNKKAYSPERRRSSAANLMDFSSHSRSPNRDEALRKVSWQPGRASAATQQARAGASSPVQMYPRKSSSMTPPPPQQQRSSSSGEWRRQSRSGTSLLAANNSNGWESRGSPGPPPRPHSRNASKALNYSDMTSQLSAREQEHVARVTGSAFFNLSNQNSKQEVPIERNGLIRAIGEREREKREMRDSVSNQMVAHAIAQRHQQQQQQHARSMTPGPGGYRKSMYSLPGANRTWDAFSQFHPAADEGRRQSYYGQITPSAPQLQQQQYPISMRGQNQGRFQSQPSWGGYR